MVLPCTCPGSLLLCSKRQVDPTSFRLLEYFFIIIFFPRKERHTESCESLSFGERSTNLTIFPRFWSVPPAHLCFTLVCSLWVGPARTNGSQMLLSLWCAFKTSERVIPVRAGEGSPPALAPSPPAVLCPSWAFPVLPTRGPAECPVQHDSLYSGVVPPWGGFDCPLPLCARATCSPAVLKPKDDSSVLRLAGCTVGFISWLMGREGEKLHSWKTAG